MLAQNRHFKWENHQFYIKTHRRVRRHAVLTNIVRAAGPIWREAGTILSGDSTADASPIDQYSLSLAVQRARSSLDICDEITILNTKSVILNAKSIIFDTKNHQLEWKWLPRRGPQQGAGRRQG